MEELKDYTVGELEDWSKKIEDIAGSFGLDWYPQEFEVIDYEMMLGNLAYHGIPAYYSHWSFGKSYERQATLYQYGLTHLPYELVINSNPSIAYLMNENPLPLQILTMAHVYAHNNFFKNNVNFQKGTRAELALEFFRAAGKRIRAYKSDPSIGHERVEKCLDAAHALMYHCSRIPGVEYVPHDEKLRQLKAKYYDGQNSQENKWAHTKLKQDDQKPDFVAFPVEPEENLLLFMRDHSPRRLESWQKDIMTIVTNSWGYFKPQILTKIMNEGWASYWHHKIIRSLPLSADLRLSIGNYHSKVVRLPENPLYINPYHIGIEMWLDIFKRYEEPEEEDQRVRHLIGGDGKKQIFHVMRTANDASFLQAYLTQELMAKLHLFSYGVDNDDVVVNRVIEDDTWKDIKNLLLRDVGLGFVPSIKVLNGDYEARSIFLKHYSDGRNLDKEYAKKTLEHIYYFWGRPVYLETATYKRKTPYTYKYDGTHHTSSRKK